MRTACALATFFLAGVLRAQVGQPPPNPSWPCVPGRPVDPAYLDVSESTGGQLFLFQPGEAAQAALVMNASHTHPATVLRMVGQLNGARDIQFPLESGVESVLFLVSLQCPNSIRVYRPGGAEVTAVNAARSLDLRAGRILRIDQPESGAWRLQLTGSGLFVASVLAKADIALSGVSAAGGNVEARLGGGVRDVQFQLVDAAGDPASGAVSVEPGESGVYRAPLAPRSERFRLLVRGIDGAALPFERTYPVLFRATPR
ncbi:MAG: hypothetical protein JST11_02210 [Acidobacteria bacterium]|nr:hypothetical protein [Acidobacteriota bacterium]